MENVVPPFKVDIAGRFLLPQTLKDAREQCRNEQISLAELRAMEDAEIRILVEKLKNLGLKVVTDGCFRSNSSVLDFMCSFEGVQLRSTKKTVLESTGRIDLHHHPVLDHFMFLTGVTGGDMIAKQVLPAPSRLLAELVKEDNKEQLEAIYPERKLLLEDIATTYRKLIDELYKSGCRYLQFDDIAHTVTPDGIAVNNMALEEHAQELFVAFHAPTEMLFSVNGIDAFFLDYANESCGKNRLLWFIREKRSTFGFVLSHYPVEEELDELRAKIDEVTKYIPLKRFSLCLPNPKESLGDSVEVDQAKQWNTLKMAGVVSKELWGEEE